MENITYYTNPTTGKLIQLPLSKGPVRFAVINKAGLSSNSWRVWVERHGDVHIASRDHMRNQLKISLHRSGQQQIAFTVESSLEVTEGNDSSIDGMNLNWPRAFAYSSRVGHLV